MGVVDARNGLPLGARRGFDLRGGTTLSQTELIPPLDAAWSTALPDTIYALGVAQHAVVIAFPLDDGTLPNAFEWIVVINSHVLV